jgi:hypothetical protein
MLLICGTRAWPARKFFALLYLPGLNSAHDGVVLPPDVVRESSVRLFHDCCSDGGLHSQAGRRDAVARHCDHGRCVGIERVSASQGFVTFVYHRGANGIERDLERCTIGAQLGGCWSALGHVSDWADPALEERQRRAAYLAGPRAYCSPDRSFR